MGGSFTLYLKEVAGYEADTGNGFRLGLADYPIFDNNYRVGLNQKILNHFWNREIGLETHSLFVFNLRRKMFEIMPYYNQMYESTLIQFDPLATFNLKTIRDDTVAETATGTSTANQTGTTNTTGSTVNSDTPQTQLSEDEDYATSGSVSGSNATQNNTNTGNSSSTTNNTLNGNSTTTGFQGSAADLLMKYRATLVTVDMMVIGELNELFMSVWDNGEEMLPNIGQSLYGYYGGIYS